MWHDETMMAIFDGQNSCLWFQVELHSAVIIDFIITGTVIICRSGRGHGESPPPIYCGLLATI